MDEARFGSAVFSGSSTAGCASTIRASPIACRRCARSLVRQRRSSVRMPAGMSAGSWLQSGSTFKIDASVSLTDSPWNACVPARISKSTAPNENTSARRSAAFPRACSGAI
jgi:hypothetical protein